MSVTVNSYVPKAIKLVNKGVDNGLLEVAINVTSQAKSLANFNKGYQTGQTKAGLMWKGKEKSGGKTAGDDLTEKPKALEYVVGVNNDHAIYPEFGTRNMDAQPYLRPAVDIDGTGMSGEAAMAKAQLNSVKRLPTK